MFYEPPIGWTKLLYEAYPELDRMPDVDWDGDGRLESDEIIDTNSDFCIDESEARRFIMSGADRDLIAFSIPFRLFAEESGFSPENPIHDFILYDSQTKRMSYEDIQAVYSDLKWVLDYVKARYDEKMTPEEKLTLVREAMLENGAVFNVDTALLTDAIMSGTFDCDTGAYVLKAVAYELGWPVDAVLAPKHMFVRWEEDEANYINFEVQSGEFTTDDYYMSWLNIDPASVSQSVYLAGLTERQMKADFVTLEASIYLDDGAFSEAQELFLMARDEGDIYPGLFANLGWLEFERGNYEGAVEYFDTTLKLDPNDLYGHIYRIYSQLKLHDFRGLAEKADRALLALDRAPEADDYLFGVVQEMTSSLSVAGGQFRDAEVGKLIDDLQGKLSQMTERFYYKRGSARLVENNFSEAIWDFSMALIYDSTDINARWYRAVAYYDERDYRNAIDDLDVLMGNVTNTTSQLRIRTVRAAACFSAGDYERAIDDLKVIAGRGGDVNGKANVYGMMALSSLELGKLDDAADYLKEARALVPEYRIRFEDSPEHRRLAQELKSRLPDLDIQFI